MENLNLKLKSYKKATKTLQMAKLRPDLKAFAPNLPWHDFSLEGGYIFSHLDGQMIGTYKTENEEITGILD